MLKVFIFLLCVGTAMGQYEQFKPIGAVATINSNEWVVDKNCVATLDEFRDGLDSLFLFGLDSCDQYFKAYSKGRTFLASVLEIKDSRTYIDRFKYMVGDEKVFYDHTYNKLEFEFITKKIKNIETLDKKIRSKGIGILDLSAYDISEYTDGTGLKVSFINPLKKSIKYAWFTVRGFNVVDDPVGAVKVVKCIGPVSYNQVVDFEFEYVWYTDIVEYVKLIGLKIQYMDGSIINVANPKNAILNNDESKALRL